MKRLHKILLVMTIGLYSNIQASNKIQTRSVTARVNQTIDLSKKISQIMEQQGLLRKQHILFGVNNQNRREQYAQAILDGLMYRQALINSSERDFDPFSIEAKNNFQAFEKQYPMIFSDNTNLH